MQGWGKRFGATLADTESAKIHPGFALSTIFIRISLFSFAQEKA